MNDFSNEENQNKDFNSENSHLNDDKDLQEANNELPKILSDGLREEIELKRENKKTKKFVIPINNEYIEFFENLSPDERTEIVNNILKTKIENLEHDRKIRFLKFLLKHLIIIAMTIIIGFPIIFYIVNTSINSTLKSYKYMQINFEKLYQQKYFDKY